MAGWPLVGADCPVGDLVKDLSEQVSRLVGDRMRPECRQKPQGRQRVLARAVFKQSGQAKMSGGSWLAAAPRTAARPSARAPDQRHERASTFGPIGAG